MIPRRQLKIFSHFAFASLYTPLSEKVSIYNKNYIMNLHNCFCLFIQSYSLLYVGDSSFIKQEVLDLALKYNFVTELTSLIVVQESILEKVPREDISLYRYATLGKGTGGDGHETDDTVDGVFLLTGASFSNGGIDVARGGWAPTASRHIIPTESFDYDFDEDMSLSIEDEDNEAAPMMDPRFYIDRSYSDDDDDDDSRPISPSDQILPAPDPSSLSSVKPSTPNMSNTTEAPPPKGKPIHHINTQSPPSGAFRSLFRSSSSEDTPQHIPSDSEADYFLQVSESTTVVGCLNTISALYTINGLC